MKNESLYAGCKVEEVAGRLNLVTPITEAINIVGRNINKMVQETTSYNRNIVILTGPMAVWAYLIVFHACVHLFHEVRYNDGKNEVIVARHG